MHLTGRIRRLFSTSSGPLRSGGRRSDVSEDSSISYDRSSGSFVQRVATSFRSRTRKRKRSASESAVHEQSFDGSSIFPDEASIQQPTPPRTNPLLPPMASGSSILEPATPSPTATNSPPNPPPAKFGATLRDTTALEVVRRRGNLIERSGEANGDLAWNEDGPSPQERQKAKDLVAAWLDTSHEIVSPSPSRIPLPLLEIPEEETELVPVRQPLRTLDSISEDEVPEFAGSSTTTVSTPMISSLSRSRSRSPPLRRRSLDGSEEHHMRGLDTIQESDPLPLPPSRRSLDSIRKPLEAIPEAETVSPSPRRRLAIKGFGLQRSESEPSIVYGNSPKRAKQPGLGIATSFRTTIKPVKEESTIAPQSPNHPSFQRDSSLIMRKHSKSSPAVFPRKPLSPTMHMPGSIALHSESIKEEEPKRLTEAAYLG